MNELKEIILMVGIQGAGKSTYINKYMRGYQVLCLDDIRLALGDVYNRRAEPIVRAMADIMGRAFLERGLPVVVDGVNTSKYIVQKWRTLADEYGYRLCGIHIDTPFQTCIERRLGINKVTMEVLEKTKDYLQELLIIQDQYFNTFKVVEEKNGIFIPKE